MAPNPTPIPSDLEIECPGCGGYGWFDLGDQESVFYSPDPEICRACGGDCVLTAAAHAVYQEHIAEVAEFWARHADDGFEEGEIPF